MNTTKVILVLALFGCLYQTVSGQDSTTEITLDTIRAAKIIQVGNDLMYTNPDSANLKYYEALNILQKHDLPIKHAKVYLKIGFVHSLKGDFPEALQNDLLSLEKAKLSNDSLLLMKVFNNIGDDHMNSRNYEIAYDFFSRALQVANKYDKKNVIATVNFNMGFVLKALGRYNEAKERLIHAHKISSEINEHTIIAHSLDELGHLYFLQENYPEAKKSLVLAKSLIDSLDIKEARVDNLTKLSDVYIQNNEFSTAIELLDKALRIALIMNNDNQQSSILNQLANIYLQQKKYNNAREVLNQSILISKNSKNDVEIYESYMIYSHIEEETGNPTKALGFLRKHNHFKDSIDEILLNTRISNFQLQVEIDKKDFEISLLNAREQQRLDEIQKQKSAQNVLVVLMALLLFLLITVYRSGIRRRKINILLQQHKEEVVKKNNELDELIKVKDKFISILAHDLRSPIRSLSAILGLAVKQQMTEEELKSIILEIKTRTEQTSNLLDNLLEWALLQMDKITVNKTSFDIHLLVESNLEMINNMTGKDIEFKNKVESLKINADKNMIDLAIRNLLSNAIKFTKEGEVIVGLKKFNGEVIISVQDSGKGLTDHELANIFDENKMMSNEGTGREKGTGLGLKLTKEFVERNGGKIWAENNPTGGSVFSFSLPVK
ncbi:MAG: tetratricopeptide repeat protein [Cyclobacteriaceae bacterium]|nr:tetratricopeptide repeat protein [Cyclobacteriaceae bacterium]